jgi:division protein CdvB (Snf7/Vps24/ESCRT-III family)
MKRKDLMKRLRKMASEQGVELTEKEGGLHTKVFLGEHFVVVPRHTEINEYTAKGILRDAEAPADEKEGD